MCNRSEADARAAIICVSRNRTHHQVRANAPLRGERTQTGNVDPALLRLHLRRGRFDEYEFPTRGEAAGGPTGQRSHSVTCDPPSARTLMQDVA